MVLVDMRSLFVVGERVRGVLNGQRLAPAITWLVLDFALNIVEEVRA